MNNKPPQIIELEKILGFELEEKTNLWNILYEGKTYLVDKKQKIIGLNLYDCHIKDILFLKEFINLKYLYLHKNQIIDISVLKYLINLKWLGLADNQILDIHVLQNLINLLNLNLSNNQISEYSYLKNLNHLKTLNLSSGQISNISFLEDLNNLVSLNLSYNKITDILFLKGLVNLTSLDLSSNQIIDITPLKNLINLTSLDLSSENFSDLLFFKDITRLYLNGNQISDYSVLKYLKKLKIIDLNSNQIIDISFLKDLINLTELYLGNNQIIDISPLKSLKNLISLDLNYNQIPNISLPFIHQFPKLDILYLYGNPIQNIPKNIFDKGNQNVLKEVKDYLQSIEKESKPLNEAKMNIIGVGEVGKSEITDALSDLDYIFDEKRSTTHGIRIKTWIFSMPNQNMTFRANIWDFAGQKENYNTHQFFLAENSVNVFVWETRKGEQQSKFDYWLSIVSLLSENAPIFVVQNKVDIYDTEINQKDWKEKFPHIVDFYKTSCKTGEGINILREAIQKQLTKTQQTLWNPDRFRIRELLENDTREYISLEDYIGLCKENNLRKEEAFFLSEQLHQLGIILHFGKDSLLKNTLVLKSEWATDAAYCLVDTKKVKAGCFTKNQLESIWSDERFEYKHDFLLELMKKFELIFQFQESDRYIVPEGLPINPSQEAENFVPQNTSKNLRFEYHYDFMPKGILSRLICRLHHIIKDDFFWRYGVILQYENHTEARIILNEVESQIKIEIWGKDCAGLLFLIRSNMQAIHQSLKNPPFKEKIPCVCSVCKDSKKPYLHEYITLLNFQNRGKSTRECAISAEDVNIATLLEGVLDLNDEKNLLYQFETAIEKQMPNLLGKVESQFNIYLNQTHNRGIFNQLKNEFFSRSNNFNFEDWKARMLVFLMQ